jgi:uncharacterized protein
MVPFRFGAPERELYGVYHPAQARRQPETGLLLCNPFGQEAVRAHRMYRVLAERLARSGFAVLRFDYFATGDSAGQDDEGELDGWCLDIAAAHAELRQRSRCSRTVWAGTRLGATLCAMASSRAGNAPDRLVLWDPVVDGSEYLAELEAGHLRALKASYDILPNHLPVQPGREAMGFALGEALSNQLAQLKAETLRGLLPAEVVLIANPGKVRVDEAFRKRPGRFREVRFEHAFDWTSEEALNSALVPSDAIQLLARQVEEGFR